MQANKIEINKIANVSLSNIGQSVDQFELEWLNKSKFKLATKNQNDGKYIIRFISQDRIYTSQKNQIIDFKTHIKDKIGLKANNFYFLYAFFNPLIQEIQDYGLFKQPKILTSSSTEFTKGKEAIITTTDNCYQFTKGARIIVWKQEDIVGGDVRNNLGIILNIISKTQLKIKLDNNDFYGSDFTDIGVTILQTNLFKPWIVSSNEQKIYNQNYKLISAGFRINDNLELENFKFHEFKYNYFSQEINYVITTDSIDYDRVFYFFELMPPTTITVDLGIKIILDKNNLNFYGDEHFFYDMNGFIIGCLQYQVYKNGISVFNINLTLKDLLLRYKSFENRNPNTVREISLCHFKENI